MRLCLSLAALAFVVWPLLKPGPAPVMVEDDRLTELLGRKDAVLKAIKDLEFDYQVGKLSEEDYQLYDQRLRRQAVGLLQQIEQVAPQSADLDAALEAEIAQRRRVLEPARAAVKPAAAAAVAASAPVPVAAQTPALAVAGARCSVGNGTVSGGAAPRYCTNCGSRSGCSSQVLCQLRDTVAPRPPVCTPCLHSPAVRARRCTRVVHHSERTVQTCARCSMTKPLACVAGKESPRDSRKDLPWTRLPPIDDRVGDLLAQMTLDEKIAQLGSCWVFRTADPHEV